MWKIVIPAQDAIKFCLRSVAIEFTTAYLVSLPSWPHASDDGVYGVVSVGTSSNTCIVAAIHQIVHLGLFATLPSKPLRHRTLNNAILQAFREAVCSVPPGHLSEALSRVDRYLRACREAHLYLAR